MLSSVSGMSREELERMGHAIGQAVLERRTAGETGSGLEQPIPLPTDPSPSVLRRQTEESDTEIPDDFIPTQTEMDEINRVVLDKDFTMSSEEVEEEDETQSSLITRISNLEKTQGDILTLLRSMNDRFNSVVPESPLESTRRRVQFATDETVEPRTPHAVARVDRETDLPHTNLLKDLKPPSFGGEKKERNKDAVNMFLHKWGDIHSLRRNPEEVRPIEASLSLTGKAYKW